jgi:F-type H+-transporting ATPase subunit c
MESTTWIGITSIAASAICMCMGAVGPALGEAKALGQALSSIAQQPDEAGPISRTLFIGLAMIESIAIYCFVISIILIFANPFWNHTIATAVGKGGGL